MSGTWWCCKAGSHHEDTVPYRKNGIPLKNWIRAMGCKNKYLGTENENFSSNQSGATQEEKGQSVLQHRYGCHCAAALKEEMGSEGSIITAGLEVGVALMGLPETFPGPAPALATHRECRTGGTGGRKPVPPQEAEVMIVFFICDIQRAWSGYKCEFMSHGNRSSGEMGCLGGRTPLQPAPARSAPQAAPVPPADTNKAGQGGREGIHPKNNTAAIQRSFF